MSKAAKQASSSSPSQQLHHRDAPPPELYSAFPTESLKNSVVFYAIGDFGDYTQNSALAKAMEKLAIQTKRPDMILALGDNFYPSGPTKDTAKIEFQAWRARFCQGALEGVPWKIAQGNHDYEGDMSTILNFTNASHEENPHGAWQCRGNDPSETPSTRYTFSQPLAWDGPNMAVASTTAAPAPAPAAAASSPSSSPTCSSPSASSSSDQAPSKAGTATSNGSDDDDYNNYVEPDYKALAAKKKFASSSAAQQQNLPVCGLVHFTCFDTNVVSGAPRRRYPELLSDFPGSLKWLYETFEKQQTGGSSNKGKNRGNAAAAANNTPNLWRICFAHHPCYCIGAGHHHQAMALHAKNGKTAKSVMGQSVSGNGFENVLINSNVDLYISGHEHVAHVTERDGGVIHAVSGAGAEYLVYGGMISKTNPLCQPFDWQIGVGKRAFLCGVITADAESKTTSMTLSYISVDKPMGSVLYSRTWTKPLL